MFKFLLGKLGGWGLLSGAAPWIFGIAAVVMLGGFTFHKTVVWGLKKELTAAQTDVGRLTQEKAQLRQSVNGLTDALNKQNKAVKDLMTASGQQIDAANAAVARIQTEVAKWRGKYTTLLNQPKPPKPQECDETAKMMQQYYELRGQEAAATPEPEEAP